MLDNIKCQVMSTILNISSICQRPLHSLCLELRCKDRQTFQNEQEKMKKNWFQEDKKKGTNSYSLFLFLYKSASASTLLLNFSRTFCGETISKPLPFARCALQIRHSLRLEQKTLHTYHPYTYQKVFLLFD